MFRAWLAHHQGGHISPALASCTHSNQQAAPVTVQYSSTTRHILTNLWQFYHILETMKRLEDFGMQLCIPWWRASEARNVYELTY